MFGETKKDLDNGITLLQGHFDLKILRKTKKLLGIEFEKKNEKLYIHQSSYIEKLCKQHERFKFPVSSLPISKGLVLSKLDCPSTPAEINEMAKYPNRNLIGSLSFIAARTRPDIMYVVNLLSQFQSNPGIKHWNKFGFVEVRLDDGVMLPAGWCVNCVWVPWMSTSSPRYRLGRGENVICQSAHLGDLGTGSTSFQPNCHRRCYCFLFVSPIM
ncbi:retrovirus-related Pol polyprotein from transposon TNT 1-94 [Trichonephila clavipes]|nr:retrovirus-related Pol polyprotein from transposon TNT 1-94 [Trichonephila clavipes]